MYCPYVIVALLGLLAPTAHSQPLPLRWNVGGTEPWVDPDGNLWQPDAIPSGFSITAPCTQGLFIWSEIEGLVCSRKEWDESVSLEFPVPNAGMYEADLHFAESPGTRSSRILDVWVEGNLVYPNLNIMGTNQAPTSQFSLTVTYPVTDGSFSLRIDGQNGDRATLAGIELVRTGEIPFQQVQAPVPTPPAPTPPAPTLPVLAAPQPGPSPVSFLFPLPDSQPLVGQPAPVPTMAFPMPVPQPQPSPTFTFPITFMTPTGGTTPVEPPAQPPVFATPIFQPTPTIPIFPITFMQPSPPTPFFTNPVPERNDPFIPTQESMLGFPTPSTPTFPNPSPFTFPTPTGPTLPIPPPTGPTVPIAFNPPPPTPFFPLPVPAPVLSPSMTAAEIALNTWRVNIGSIPGMRSVDEDGNTWESDSALGLGGRWVDACATHPFPNYGDADLVCNFREWSTPSTGVMEFPVTVPGIYTVKLILPEISAAESERVVNVFLEGREVYTDLDVTERIGGEPYGVFTLTMGQFITDGSVSIELVASRGVPVLGAVEVVPGGPTRRRLWREQALIGDVSSSRRTSH